MSNKSGLNSEQCDPLRLWFHFALGRHCHCRVHRTVCSAQNWPFKDWRLSSSGNPGTKTIRPFAITDDAWLKTLNQFCISTNVDCIRWFVQMQLINWAQILLKIVAKSFINMFSDQHLFPVHRLPVWIRNVAVHNGHLQVHHWKASTTFHWSL